MTLQNLLKLFIIILILNSTKQFIIMNREIALINALNQEIIPEQTKNEKQNLINEIAKELSSHERINKMVAGMLTKNGYLEAMEKLETTEMLLTRLMAISPTIKDIKDDLKEFIKNTISVAIKKGESTEKHQKRMEVKQSQYKAELSILLKSLKLVYDQFGTMTSQKNKDRIINNIKQIMGNMNPFIIEREYLEANVKAALDQDWNTQEKTEIKNQMKIFIKILESAGGKSARLDEELTQILGKLKVKLDGAK